MPAKAGATKLLERIMTPLGRALTPVAAKEILAIRVDEKARRRIKRLAAKCDQGTLTPEESAEYHIFIEVGDIVALLQAQARRFMAGH
ncbi:MAG TPA: hypothetical protein VHB20_16985 [Verrucomicrobiae bacterium]|jgi:hypothetical protein|nr:hypothetical protein [Verrucomicrobiae bacterium]